MEDNKQKNQDLNLGSSLYESIAVIFATTLVIFGVILILADFGFGLGITTMVTGAFIYVSISWFGRVLKGLEQNNAYLQKILKASKSWILNISKMCV